jgi:hypothetical protein
MFEEIKTVVSVAEMARMIGLSRARFYQLIGSAFPFPLYAVSTHRPFYDLEGQRVCLEVRTRNCGINGKPILFYARRVPISSTTKRSTRKTPPKVKPDSDILDSLKALGLSVSPAQVEAAIRVVFPHGRHGTALEDVVRKVFIHLQRSGSNPAGW